MEETKKSLKQYCTVDKRQFQTNRNSVLFLELLRCWEIWGDLGVRIYYMTTD